MNNGEIVEQGTHTELSSMAGVYSGLLHKFAVVEDNAELDKIMEVSEKDLVIEGGGVLSGDSGLISLSIVSALSSARSIAAPSRREKSFFLDRNDAETASETQVWWYGIASRISLCSRSQSQYSGMAFLLSYNAGSKKSYSVIGAS